MRWRCVSMPASCNTKREDTAQPSDGCVLHGVHTVLQLKIAPAGGDGCDLDWLAPRPELGPRRFPWSVAWRPQAWQAVSAVHEPQRCHRTA